MRMATDFGRLYAQVGIGPDCTIDAFKQACRRQIANQHPDRGASDDTAAMGIEELIAAYEQAVAFHRQHGRLPGARASAGAASAMGMGSTLGGNASTGTRPPLNPGPRARNVPMADDSGRGKRTALFAWIAILVLLLIGGLWEQSSQTSGGGPIPDDPALDGP